MKLLTKTKKNDRTVYEIRLSGAEFNFLRLCLNSVINTAGADRIAKEVPYSAKTITTIRDRLDAISETEADSST